MNGDVGGDVGLFALFDIGEVDVGECGIVVVLDVDAKVVREFAIDKFFGVRDTVIDDIGAFGAECFADELADFALGVCASAFKLIVVNVDGFAVGIVRFVFDFAFG